MSVTIKGLTEAKADFKKIAAVLGSSSVLAGTMQDIRNMVVQRTLAGLDVDLKAFVPYSRERIYISLSHRPKPQGGRRQHQKTGRSLKTVAYDGGYAQFARETKGGEDPNLFATGDMLRSFQPSVRSAKGTRGIVHFTRLAAALKAIGNQSLRNFVGVNVDRELPLIQRSFDRRLKREIRKRGVK